MPLTPDVVYWVLAFALSAGGAILAHISNQHSEMVYLWPVDAGIVAVALVMAGGMLMVSRLVMWTLIRILS